MITPVALSAMPRNRDGPRRSSCDRISRKEWRYAFTLSESSVGITAILARLVSNKVEAMVRILLH